jgi:hypothetical protein
MNFNVSDGPGTRPALIPCERPRRLQHHLKEKLRAAGQDAVLSPALQAAPSSVVLPVDAVVPAEALSLVAVAVP